MREMGLEAIFPGPNLSKRRKPDQISPYLLRGLTITRANQVWGIDITSVRLHQGWMYLVAILDCYARYVVGWELDQTLAMPFVLLAVERALLRVKPEIVNSDQGSHFTSPYDTTLLKAHAVQRSQDGKGRALDNVFPERLWRTVKDEDVSLQDYQSRSLARGGMSD